MGKPRAAVILAAGRSTRMKSARSKVLHEVGGRPLLDWVAAVARDVGVEKIVCVIGKDSDDVRQAAEAQNMEIAIQDPPLGTGHAVLAAKDALAGFDGNVVVLYGDTPLITKDSLQNVFDKLDGISDILVMGFEPDDAAAYGRLVTDGDELQAIVEAKDATPEQLEIRLCNSGVMAASKQAMFGALSRVGNANAKGEYYLTDIVEIIRSDGGRAGIVHAHTDEVIGVNSRQDLAIVEQAFQNRMRNQMMDDGVTLRDPSSTYFSYDTVIAADAEIGANVIFGKNVTIDKDAVIHPFCHLEGASIGKNAQIGPFARLRPGTRMGENSKAGNFVETKKADIGKGSKINHLTYIGDAVVGEGANVGAGTITCNYDGYSKHLTEIGDGAFVGSNSSLVAPIKIGKGAYLGSGGVITKDVPADALAVARSEQVNKEGWAKRYRSAQEKRKAKK